MNNKHVIVDKIVLQLENNIKRRGSDDNLTVIQIQRYEPRGLGDDPSFDYKAKNYTF